MAGLADYQAFVNNGGAPSDFYAQNQDFDPNQAGLSGSGNGGTPTNTYSGGANPYAAAPPPSSQQDASGYTDNSSSPTTNYTPGNRFTLDGGFDRSSGRTPISNTSSANTYSPSTNTNSPPATTSYPSDAGPLGGTPAGTRQSTTMDPTRGATSAPFWSINRPNPFNSGAAPVTNSSLPGVSTSSPFGNGIVPPGTPLPPAPPDTGPIGTPPAGVRQGTTMDPQRGAVNADNATSHIVSTPTAAATNSTPAPAASQYFPGTQIPTSNPFGANPFASNPGYNGPNGPGGYNPQTFATQATAQQVASMFGGTVVSGQNSNMLGANGSTFQTNQPQYMVKLANGTVIDPAAIARAYGTLSDPSQSVQLQANIQDILNGSNGTALNIPGLNGINAPINQNQAAAGQFGPAIQSAQASGQAPPSSITNQPFAPATAPYTQSFSQGAPAASGTPAPTTTTDPYAQFQQFMQQYQAGQQQQQQQYSPFSFGSQVNQLYGGNPFTAAAGGNSGLGNLLSLLMGGSSGGNSQSMSSVASILDALMSSQNNTRNPALSPLFWNSGQQTPLSNYYPAFY